MYLFRIPHNLKVIHKMITNIRELNNKNPAFFSNYNIINYNNYLQGNNVYLLGKSHNFIADIPLSQIIGIDQMYGGSSWGELLNGAYLKRINSNLKRLENNPSYYLSDEHKSGISFVKIGEHYFIRSGKHRTIISRFFSHFNPELFLERSPLRNIHITEYIIDIEYTAIQKSIEEVRKSYPNLKFVLNHTTDFTENRFLKISAPTNSNRISFFSRYEYHEVIKELKNPNIVKKWQDANKRSYGMPSIYKFISFKKCLSHIFNVVKRSLLMEV